MTLHDADPAFIDKLRAGAESLRASAIPGHQELAGLVDAARAHIQRLELTLEAHMSAGFQAEVRAWADECFGVEVADDRAERNHRFLEEALELVQATGCMAEEAHRLVDYVYGRAVGEPVQEVGGVLVTLAALCSANRIDMTAAGAAEVARIWTKIPQIRAKHAAKPRHSPLPA